MKKLLVAVLINLFVLAARSQGIVYFANVDGTDVNAPVYESDGVTKVSGPQYMAQLLGGPSASSMVSIASTSFLTGAGAGYFLGGNQTIPDVFPGNVAWVEVLVWNGASGASFDQAKASGLPNSWWDSSVFSVRTSQFNGVAVEVPLTGLGNSPVYLNRAVPEPSSLALAGLGLSVALIRACQRKWPSE